MGVFSWFSRKPKGSSDEATATPGASAEAETPPAGGECPGAKPPAESESEPQPAGVETAPTGTAPDAKAPDASGVDIPRQQSAEDAADSEAGEGARK
ncbi:hypothetical protein ACH4E8_18415 [Streptomyces sp. NPDC017979]|uniref:hypothetical protein n=1 Tax=Streptomyces sp. NPDC017979 TaxID=3365024 RepID=UPI003799CB63